MNDGGFCISPIGIPAPLIDFFDERPLTPVPQLQTPSPSESCMSKITPLQLKEFIEYPEKTEFQKIIICDARFDYEYEGGHIVGALNVRTKRDLLSLFKKYKGLNVAFVFHCEFSHDRGPNTLTLFRNIDRQVNNYPHLTFPHIYLLEGGYSKFYQQFKGLCKDGYVQMYDKEHANNGDLKRSNALYRREIVRGSQMIKRGGNKEIVEISSFSGRNFSQGSFDDSKQFPSSQGSPFVTF